MEPWSLNHGNVPGTDTTKYLVGTVIEASAAAAEYCSVWVNCPTAGRAA